jgi:hypothetical protein
MHMLSLLQEEELRLARLLVSKGARTADGRTCAEVAVERGWVTLLQACLGESSVMSSV